MSAHIFCCSFCIMLKTTYWLKSHNSSSLKWQTSESLGHILGTPPPHPPTPPHTHSHFNSRDFWDVLCSVCAEENKEKQRVLFTLSLISMLHKELDFHVINQTRLVGKVDLALWRVSYFLHFFFNFFLSKL